MESKWFLFGNVKDYIWKTLIGLGSIISALELFSNRIDSYLGVEFKYGVNIFIFLYFIAPLLIFILWWKFKLKTSIPDSFNDNLKLSLNRFGINNVFSRVIALSIPIVILSLFIYADISNWGYYIYLVATLLLMLLVLSYAFQFFRKIKHYPEQSEVAFVEWLNLGKLHFIIIISTILVISTMFFVNHFKDNLDKRRSDITIEQFKREDVNILYDKVGLLRKFNKQFNGIINKAKVAFWSRQFREGKLEKEETNIQKYNDLLTEFNQRKDVSNILASFDKLEREADSIRIGYVLVEVKDHTKNSTNLKKVRYELTPGVDVVDKCLLSIKSVTKYLNEDPTFFPIVKTWLNHIKVINNNTLVLYERELTHKLDVMRQSFRFKGVSVYVIFLCFLLILWFHVFVENLRRYIQEKNKDKWKDYSTLSFTNNYIILVIILIIPVFTSTDNKLSFEKPLWGGLWDAPLFIEEADISDTGNGQLIRRDTIREIILIDSIGDNSDNTLLLDRIGSIEARMLSNARKIKVLPKCFKALDENILHYSKASGARVDLIKNRPYKSDYYESLFEN